MGKFMPKNEVNTWGNSKCSGALFLGGTKPCNNEPVLCKMCAATLAIQKASEERDRCRRTIREVQAELNQVKAALEALMLREADKDMVEMLDNDESKDEKKNEKKNEEGDGKNGHGLKGEKE